MLVNAAREPEIADLADCLDRDGRARSTASAPTGCASRGVDRLHGAEHRVIPDRIETGTYMMAAAITGGEVELDRRAARPSSPRWRASSTAPASRCSETADGIRVRRAQRPPRRRRRDDRALSRLPDRSAGADDGADDDRRRRLDDHRDDLREPLHACAGAVPHGRQHQRPRRLGAWCAACRG